jgi:peptide deformylase
MKNISGWSTKMNALTKVLTRPAKIVTMGHPTLRKIATPLSDDFIKSNEGRKFIDQMLATLKASDDGVIHLL